MIRFTPIDDTINEISFSLPLKSMLVLRVLLKSNFLAPAVIQPTLNNWIANDGSIYPAQYKILPSHVYMSPGAEISITISVQIPEDVEEGSVIHSMIQFSGFKNSSVRIKLNVNGNNVQDHISEHALELTIPMSHANERQHDDHVFFRSEQTAKIIGSLTGLEILPAKWLVAELVLAVCERGLHAAEQKETQVFIEKLRRTQFFKNGVLVTASSQFVHWIMISLSISSGLQAVSGSKLKTSRMLYSWEDWLFNLVDKDIEIPGHADNLQYKSEYTNEVIIEKLGMEPERWFLFLLLGLMQVSPRINSVIKQVADKVPDAQPQTEKKTNNRVKKVLKEKGSLQR